MARLTGFILGFSALLSVTVHAATVLTANDLAPNSLVVTEYLANPVGVSDSQAEYFEIFNATSSTVDLTNLVVRDDGSNEFSITGLLIRARDFAVLSNSDGVALAISPDYVYGGDMSLTNSDDEIGLFRPDGALVHKVAYSDGDFFGGGIAHELASLSSDTSMLLFGPSIGIDFIAAARSLPLGNFGSPGDAGRTIIDLPSPPTVPVPAAVWLFASALSILGWIRGNREPVG